MSDALGSHYEIGPGRARPPFEPKLIRCSVCGAQLSTLDERTEQIVCPSCDSQLHVTGVQQRVLGKSNKHVSFALDLGDSFTWEDHRYEVMARIASIEDGDLTEMTRDYLLFSPRRGTLWLSEYAGQWSIARRSHVQPEESPFLVASGGSLTTYDGREWTCIEGGTYEVYYVDGALPYVCKVGDRSNYVDFTDGERGQFSAETSKSAGFSEVEYTVGQALRVSEVRDATGNLDIRGEQLIARSGPTAISQALSFLMLAAAAFALLVNIGLMVFAEGSGSVVYSTTIDPSSLTQEVETGSFTIDGPTGVQIQLSAPGLDQAWMSVNVGLVKKGSMAEQDVVVHVQDGEMSRYSGYEGGEYWAEGSRSTRTNVFWVKEPGTYALIVQGVSGLGNSETASRAEHGVQLAVLQGALSSMAAMLGAIASVLGLVVAWGLGKLIKAASRSF